MKQCYTRLTTKFWSLSINLMLSSFTWIDWAIIVIIAVSAFISVGRGLVKEVMSLASWGLALLVAWRLGTPLSSYLEGYIETPSVRIIAASVAFIVTLMVGALISRAMSGLIKITGLGWSRSLIRYDFWCS